MFNGWQTFAIHQWYNPWRKDRENCCLTYEKIKWEQTEWLFVQFPYLIVAILFSFLLFYPFASEIVRASHNVWYILEKQEYSDVRKDVLYTLNTEYKAYCTWR